MTTTTWQWLDSLSISVEFQPDLICYVAGADPYREDQLVAST